MSSPDNSQLTREEANALKMVLGEYGFLILVAIQRGAKTRKEIPLLSGVPMACVTGRLPVLLNLNLVREGKELEITPKGENFLKFHSHQ